ncbi:MAG: IS200/IS605 family transposase [Acidobacteria bacterium]|nr:IS200/IS605 family transposase [Acidobacteriota bacterium]
MANTYTALYFHIIFSTKNRQNFIKQDIENQIWDYIGGILKSYKINPIKIGGYEDHIHALIKSPTTLPLSKITQYIKGSSSKWIHCEFPDLIDFGWQDGYGAFSVSRSNVPQIVKYIENQRIHHSRSSFQDEYLNFLRKHEVEYDEQYLWG